MDDNRYMNELDDFSKLIKQKLEHHEMPVDADLWKGIEKKLSTPKRIFPRWTYAAVGVAAGLALLISVGNFFNTHENMVPVSEELKQYQEEASQIAVISEINEIKEDIREESKVALVNKSKSEVKATDNELIITEDKAIATTDVIQEKETTDETKNVAINDSETVIDKPTTKDVAQSSENKQVDKNKLTELPSNNQTDWIDNLPKKKKESTSLTAALGSGVASSSATMIRRSKAYRGESLVDLPTNSAVVLTPNDFKNKQYLPPVSVGINVRLPLVRNLSVESGIAYTYLQTKLTNAFTGDDYRAEVDLHYLGVPVNLVYSFLKDKRWDIYTSAGGMIEKGLRSEFKQYQNWDNVRLDIDAATKVDGVQWSLNGTLGVGYSLFKNISLFIDPKIAYYFESDQPYSIRKELPVLISLNTGLRMSL